jgi:hypothetical protein
MWNMQNEYNSPEAQMDRYREAGLNPNLIYGNGSSSSGNATETPQYQQVRGDFSAYNPAKLVDRLSQFTNMAMQKTQIDSVKTQNQIGKQEVIRKGLENDLLSTILPYQKAQQGHLKSSKSLADLKLARTNAEIREKENQTFGQNVEAKELNNAIMRYKKELTDAGLPPDGSAPYIKMVVSLLTEMGFSVDQAMQELTGKKKPRTTYNKWNKSDVDAYGNNKISGSYK